MPGLRLRYRIRSVLRDHRAAPVEAIDQRGADGLRPRLEGHCRARGAGSDGSNKRLGQRYAIIECRTIFGLHEQAGCADSENIEVVLEAAAHEPAITIERACRVKHEEWGDRLRLRGA